jgi:integrase
LVTLPSPVRPRVEFYTEPEADAIIEWAGAQPGLRRQVGQVLLLTLRYTGLRLKELVTLRTEEVDLVARRISLVGKGRKPRVVPIPRPLETVLREYLDEMRPRLPATTYLFANLRATGASVVATGLGRCTTWSWRPGPRRTCPVGTIPTAGAKPMPLPSCAGARTFTSSGD